MKVLNICRFLPIKGFSAENDITFKIYADLEKEFQVKSLFVMPLAHIPKWAIFIKKSLKNRYNTINNKSYSDKKYGISVKFFQAYFPLNFINSFIRFSYCYFCFQYKLYKKSLYIIFNTYLPDVVHAHTINDACYAYDLFKKYNTPYILTLRGSYSKIYRLKNIKKILSNAKHIITPSYNLYKNLEKFYKIELLPHGLDESWYRQEDRKFDSSILRLVTVTRLLEMKNIQLVIKSIASLKREGCKIKYSIIGEGKYLNTLKDLTKTLNLEKEVKFYGFKSQEQIKNIFKKNDIFIMLSYPETFGRVYFEAAAQGLLIIGVKGTGADGYFTNKEAFFIEPKVDETNKILKNIDKIIFQAMTSKSKEKVLKFSNTKIINRYNTILNNSLN